MSGKTRLAQLAGVSALALVAASTLSSTPASACTAVADTTSVPVGPDVNVTTNFVTVTCVDETPAIDNSLFATSHEGGTDSGPVGIITYFDYDGSGNDVLDISGGTIENAAAGGSAPPPVTNLFPGATLDGPTAALQTLDGNDSVTISGNTVITGVLDTGDDDDTVTISAGTLGGVLLGAGADKFKMSGGLITEIPGLTNGAVNGGAGDDTIDLLDGTIEGFIQGGDGTDKITVSGGTVGGGDTFDDFVDGGGGDDTIAISGTADVLGSVFGDGAAAVQGADTISVSGQGTVLGSIFAGGGADKVTISGDAFVGIADGEQDSVGLGAGDDTFTMTGGELDGAVSGGTGLDTFNLSGGKIGTFVAGGAGNDVFNVSGTVSIGQQLTAEDGNDKVTITGGTIGTFVDLGAGDDQFAMSAGTVNGSVFGGDGANKIDVSGTALIGGAIVTGTGIDRVTIAGGQVGDITGLPNVVSINTGAGNDIFVMTGGTTNTVDTGLGADKVSIGGGTIRGGVFTDDSAPGAAQGDDIVLVTGGSIGEGGNFLPIDTGGGDDRIEFTGGRLGGAIFAGTGSDTVIISGATTAIGTALPPGVVAVQLFDGNDKLFVSGGQINGSVTADLGDDILDISGGAIAGGVDLGEGTNSLTMTGGTIALDLVGLGDGNTIAMSGGSIGGSIFTGSGIDKVTISGTAQVGVTAGGTDSVALGDGDDTFTMTGGALAAAVSGGGGIDTFNLSGGKIGTSVGGGAGNDVFNVSGTANILQSLLGDDGDDVMTVSGGTIGGSIAAGTGADKVTISGTAQVGIAAGSVDSVALEDGDDTFTMTGGTLAGAVSGGAGIDTFNLSGGNIGTSVGGGIGNDVFNISGTANIAQNLLGEDGDDTVTMSGGTIGGSIDGGGGNDTIDISGGRVADFVAGGDGDDTITISGTADIGGDVLGQAGKDRVVVSGGRIAGNIEAETVVLNGGSIGGDITGLSNNTLIIEAPNLSLRDGVLFQGTDVVGTISNTKLATGSQNFAGFSSLTLDGASTLRLAPGTHGISNLFVSDGSTLFTSGATNLVSPGGGPGNLFVTNATIDMVNGSATDVFNVGNVSFNGATMRIDVNAEQNVSDLIAAAGTFTPTGANTVFVNLVGTPQFATSRVIALAPVAGETAPTGGAASPFFTIAGLPQTPGALFDFTVITGPDGGLYLLVTADDPSIAVATRGAIDSQPVETVTMTVNDILNDTVLTHFNLLVSGNRSDAAPSFGVYASGQAAFVKHDGFNISGGGLSGTGPSFTSDDFSLAASVELNAAEYFGLDKSIGLDIGLFGGYASSAVEMNPTQLFDQVGQADNKSAMIGGYGLFRSGTTYGLVSATGFFGNTEITNNVLNSTGDYDTAGVAVTASAGHVYQIDQNWRFDLRGGILGVYFRGDPFEDSQGNDFGRSRISFGAVKFEPGIFAQYVLEDGRVLSPYARLELQQRFGYENTSSLDGIDFEFDDSDFSASGSAGVNYQVSKTTTLSSELRTKFSSDSRTFAGKIGLKARF